MGELCTNLFGYEERWRDQESSNRTGRGGRGNLLQRAWIGTSKGR